MMSLLVQALWLVWFGLVGVVVVVLGLSGRFDWNDVVAVHCHHTSGRVKTCSTFR